MIGILGASGLVGYNLFQYLNKKEQVLGTCCSKKREGLIKFDLLSDDFSIFNQCRQVIIVAAITNIDQCFLKKEEAYRVNVEKTIEFIQYLPKKGIKPIFISSDQVFDGNKGNYREEDTPNPVNHYGRFKLQVEEFMRNNLGNYLVFRLSKTYGRSLEDGGLFAEVFLKLKNNEKIKAAFNQIFNPTDVKIVCEGIHFALKKDLQSLYHLADKNIMSRYDFALRVAAEYGFNKNLIEKIDFNSLKAPEKRALNSSLNVEKLAKIMDLA